MLFGYEMRLCLRVQVYPLSGSKQTADTCRKPAVSHSVRIEYPGYLPLHILIRRMSQYHRFGGRYAPMYLQQLLSGNEEHVHHRDIRGKLRKERLISGQTMLGDAYQNTFIF